MTLNTKNIKRPSQSLCVAFIWVKPTDADLTKVLDMTNERILSIKDKTIPELDEDFLVDAHINA